METLQEYLDEATRSLSCKRSTFSLGYVAHGTTRETTLTGTGTWYCGSLLGGLGDLGFDGCLVIDGGGGEGLSPKRVRHKLGELHDKYNSIRDIYIYMNLKSCSGLTCFFLVWSSTWGVFFMRPWNTLPNCYNLYQFVTSFSERWNKDGTRRKDKAKLRWFYPLPFGNALLSSFLLAVSVSTLER